MAVHVVDEARRCLHCKAPQCRKGCPINTDIPEMIELFRSRRKEDAGAMLFRNNPLSVVCSLVCNHEAQCEGHCVLGKKGAPIQISSIENYISDAYLDHLSLEKSEPNGKRVAIIGSGPAGITISILLTQRGYSVTLFESRDKIGGVLRYGIPEFRLPKSILDRYKEQLVKLGVKIRPNTLISRAITIDDLFRDGYQAIFIGTGVWRARQLGIKGESLGHVAFAIDFLVNPDVYDLGDSMAIIGGGNSAMDVARTALRRGMRSVTIMCRGTKASAGARELDFAIADGVEMMYGASPTEITEDGVIYKQTSFDEVGNPVSVEENQFIPASNVVVSIGQGAQSRIADTTQGLQLNERGLLMTDEKGTTTRSGVFAAGDVSLGARTVVEAVRNAKQVADEIDRYLQGLDADGSS